MPGSAIRQRFLILARHQGEATVNLFSVLQPLGRVEVVVDQVGGRNGRSTPMLDPVWIPDGMMEGYGGLTGPSAGFPWISAWSRALCHVERTIDVDEGVWFVEDDVAGDRVSFASLVGGTVAREVDFAAMDVRRIEEDRLWPHWYHANGFFEQPARAFVPLCFLSWRLIKAVLSARGENGRCAFVEVMFASVVRECRMMSLSWSRDAQLGSCFGEFHYRPEVKRASGGICHPVKDLGLHRRICGVPDGTSCSQPELEVDASEDNDLFS